MEEAKEIGTLIATASKLDLDETGSTFNLVGYSDADYEGHLVDRKSTTAMTHTNVTTDQLALLSLKSQIISDPFHYLNESWSPATSVCHWVGVTCGSRHQRVKFLNLSNMALTGKIPCELGNLTFLVFLNLGSNNFHGNLPREMARLHRLKVLDLSFNSFSGEVPSYLAFNSLDGQIPKEIGDVEYLRNLNLYGNNLIGSIPPSLMNASRLETLDLSRNLLQGNISEGIGNLHNLNFLSKQDNHLTGSIPFTIFNISKIKVLALTKNSLSGDLPNGLCNDLTILKELYLSYNKFHGRMPTILSNCSQLQMLSLSYNEFNGPIQSEIGKLSNLQELYLGYNHFTGIIPLELGNLVNLMELDMGVLNGKWRNQSEGKETPKLESVLFAKESLLFSHIGGRREL
ncbi:hypothetical protein CQW23_09436 [Capsicum baccatum]|uniref:Leucine-rich repeat-containing N-terminal plant-type domain-containing protein n=1 Tax=Capsicum baccatum TaxID=33114 RepID=A0A2G2WWZ7_CAPBA|nr:hypothetical protein CQW23_09436 [Capsicum baccatum]